MSMVDSILWDVEDYAGRAVDAVKLAGKLVLLATMTYPFIVGGLLLGLGLGIWLDSGTPAPQTVQQQIQAHNQPGGTTFWLMQAQGSNPTGFFGMDDFGNKKQEADFRQAAHFCTTHTGFTGCQRVLKAANSPTAGM